PDDEAENDAENTVVDDPTPSRKPAEQGDVQPNEPADDEKHRDEQGQGQFGKVRRRQEQQADDQAEDTGHQVCEDPTPLSRPEGVNRLDASPDYQQPAEKENGDQCGEC